MKQCYTHAVDTCMGLRLGQVSTSLRPKQFLAKKMALKATIPYPDAARLDCAASFILLSTTIALERSCQQCEVKLL